MKLDWASIKQSKRALASIVVVAILLTIILFGWILPFVDSEEGALFCARVYTSGFSSYRYDEVVAIFDSGNIYSFKITENHGIHILTDNRIPIGRVNSILNQLYEKAHISLRDHYTKTGYYIDDGRRGHLSQQDLENLRSFILTCEFDGLNDRYYNYSAPTDGITATLFVSMNGIDKTVSDYGEAAPRVHQKIESRINFYGYKYCT